MRRDPGHGPRFRKPPARVFTTTLWEYPSQDYEGFVRQGPAPPPGPEPAPGATEPEEFRRGATPSWVIWQLLTRYTRPNDLVVDPMAGSGTTLDVARQLGRRALAYDLTPRRPDVFRADARHLPLEEAKADFVFIDPPYSTHLEYSGDPRDIGRLDAAQAEYYQALDGVFAEAHRVMRDRRYLAVYVSDSWRKRSKTLRPPGREEHQATAPPRHRDTEAPGQPRGAGVFMPIGFEVFALLRRRFRPIDIVCVVRHNAKLRRANWHKAAEEGNYFLRGFNYLLVFKKEP